MSLQEKENWPEPIKDKWEMIHTYRKAFSEFKKEKKRKIEEYKQTLDKDQPDISLYFFDIKCYDFLDDLRIRNVIPLPIDCSLYKIIAKAKDIINMKDIKQKENDVGEKSSDIENHSEKLSDADIGNNVDCYLGMDNDSVMKWYQNGRRELAEYICKCTRTVEGVKIKTRFEGDLNGYKGEDTEFHLTTNAPFEIIKCNDPTIDLENVEFDYDTYKWENVFNIPVMGDEDIVCDHKGSGAYADRKSNRVCFVVLKND